MKDAPIFSKTNPIDKYVIRDKVTKKTIFRLGKKLQFRSSSACQTYFNEIDEWLREDYEIHDNYPYIVRSGGNKKWKYLIKRKIKRLH